MKDFIPIVLAGIFLLGLVPDSVTASRSPLEKIVIFDAKCKSEPGKFATHPKFAWDRKLLRYLVQHGEPWIQSAVAAAQFGDDCQSRAKSREIWESVLSDPLVSVHALLKIAPFCAYKELISWCEQHRVFDRIRQNDSNNAFHILAPLLFARNTPRNNRELDKAVFDIPLYKKIVSDAANARYFDSYWGHGGMRVFPVVEQFVAENFPKNNPYSHKGIYGLTYVYSRSIVLLAAQVETQLGNAGDTHSTLPMYNVFDFCVQAVLADNKDSQLDCWKLQELIQATATDPWTRSFSINLRHFVDVANAMSFDIHAVAIDHDCFVSDLHVGELKWLHHKWSIDEEEELRLWRQEIDEYGVIETAHRHGLEGCGEEFDHHAFRMQYGIEPDGDYFGYPWWMPSRNWRPDE